MRYVDFRDQIQIALIESPDGLTWKELKEQLKLPYEQPCQTWLKQMEAEIGLTRSRGSQRAYTWKINPLIKG